MTNPDFAAILARRLPGAIPEGAAPRFCPRTDGELAVAMDLAEVHGVRLAPPGAQAGPDELPVDLGAMTDVLTFDATSGLIHVQTGLSVAAVERALLQRDLSLCVVPPVPDLPVGAWLASGAPGAPDHENDPVAGRVAGLDAVLVGGRRVRIRPAPRRAVGPDLIPAILSGRLGIATAVHLLARRRTKTTDLEFFFPTRDDARAALAWMRGRGVRPLHSALEPRAERTALSLVLSGPEAVQDAQTAVARTVATEHRGVEP